MEENKTYMTEKKKGCSILFLNKKHEVLLFLRDKKKTILYPNKWDFLGGQLEKDETPEKCIVREMKEELEIDLDNFQLFTIEVFQDREEYIFWKRVDFDISKLKLNEGQRLKWFKFKELKRTDIAFQFGPVAKRFINFIELIESFKADQQMIFDSLLEEYSQCMSNYAYRDELVPNEFNFVLAIIGAIIAIIENNDFSQTLVARIILCIIGLLCLIIFYWDLINTSSAKKAAGKRALEIEDILSEYNIKYKTDLQLAHRIGKSNFFWEQKVGFLSQVRSSNLIIWCTRFLLFLWIIYSLYKLLFRQ